ncbi:sensor histidine kinase [Polaribacter cellanae]|uniref:Histidine kinase n=1 Tax=Polaribacter cellanae TaxID=2818493 RepID=A0A975H5Q9_9FLAO|nr:histidine kinase [Polaribacter cellanae]QTE21647.1 histidine kinase [Polaribacter cellanae]
MNTKLNKSDYLLLASFYGVSSLFNIRYYILNNNNLIEFLTDIPVQVIISICLVFIFIFWLIPTFIVKNKQYVLFIILGLLALIILGGIEYTLGYWSANNSWEKFPAFNKFLLDAIDSGSESLGFPLGLLLTKKFYEGKNELISIQKQQKENELKLLRSQIDPHFLFNNLNTLDALIDSNPTKAKEYINRLSLIYRYLIQTKDAEVMELSKEINFAKNYIFLIKTRFGKDYEFKIEENTSIEDKFIPTGAIQALLENVVKHNKSDGKMSIKTTILINEGWLIITNLKSDIISKPVSLGTGLANLKARYKLLSDEQIQIHNMNKKFEVFIPIITLSE